MRRPIVVLALALVVFAIVTIAGQSDFIASDPLWYANVAHDMTRDFHGVFSGAEMHPFVMRVGLTLPLALVYKLFGVSTISTNGIALVAACAIIVIAWIAAPTPRAKLFAVLFTLTALPLLRHGAVLDVDLPCAALLGAMVLCLSRRSFTVAIVCWFAAFLVKETAIWGLPIWVYVLVVERRSWKAFIPAFVVGGVLGIVYLAICWKVWGTPLARFKGIQELDHAWSLHGQPASAWLARLTWGPARMLGTMFHVALIPVVLGFWILPKQHRIWLVATACFGLLFWFGSASLTAYNPLPLSERMNLPVLPPLLVVAALSTDELWSRFPKLRWLAIPLALVLIVPAARVALAGIRRQTPETDAFHFVRDEAKPEPVVIVCGEPRCLQIAAFYFGFDVPANVTIVHANDFAAAPEPHGVIVRALVNAPRAVGAHKTDPHSDRTGDIDAMGLFPIIDSHGVRLYAEGDGMALWRALQPATR
ncbi:MAG: hypothetical protein QM831_14370 [Kofleriaceae bacterium]